ncbi:hypothetical protein PV325_009872 [Microctonus aethiopoides]|uniref:Protein FAM60A n=1 Tax=Microctonus aethiopoides TaxID=144406 RepID=A0AA39FXG6_9HYME|nr:hypothetical protein PV325_009872 [Microctonus aethiopoides]KAK0096923.1 hypothetical protein PV326_003897 [Microctonus aethiopoides]KAK0177647.1 hypothetical protein PV328_001681 [Microctonus aethiopoides]
MFSFHKPKVYRSSTGCCICKAKSSSSRFTDSKKYEEDFIECFQLEERRTGEICNACVLLVKRWKKLPVGSNRNWRHVVDARAGPGIKSLTKFKSKNRKKPKDNLEKIEKIMKKKHVYLKPEREREQSPAMSDDLNEEYLTNTGSKGSSRSGTPEGSDDNVANAEKLLIVPERISDKNELSTDDFIDMTYFKRVTICCGIIFKGQYGEVIVDPTLIKRCANCIIQRPRYRQREANNLNNSPFHSSASASPAHSLASSSPAHSVDSTNDTATAATTTATTTTTTAKPTSKTFSDSSSDSGYDESSNQGIGESKIVKSSIINISNSTTTNLTNVKLNQVKTIQLNSTLVSETVRLQSDMPIKLIPIEQVDSFTCKPLTTLVGTTSIHGSNTHSIAVQNNPLVDFAIHASARQSIIN